MEGTATVGQVMRGMSITTHLCMLVLRDTHRQWMPLLYCNSRADHVWQQIACTVAGLHGLASKRTTWLWNEQGHTRQLGTGPVNIFLAGGALKTVFGSSAERGVTARFVLG